MKKLLFLFIALTACTATAHAQQFSKEYLDSVKSFFNDWIVNQKDFVYTVMDNTAYPTDIDFALYRIKFESLLDSPVIVYKLNENLAQKKAINDIAEKRAYSTDSIMLSQPEADSALSKLQASKEFKWTKDYFPNADIVDSARFFTRWENTMAGVPKPAYWALSLPSFFRDGNYCLMFFRYFCGTECGYEALIVYKNNNGRWERYGTLSERVFNP